MSRGLASPPPKITSVPAAGAGSPLERWKSEDAFHQDPGGGDCLARPHRDAHSSARLPPAASSVSFTSRAWSVFL